MTNNSNNNKLLYVMHQDSNENDKQVGDTSNNFFSVNVNMNLNLNLCMPGSGNQQP